jgi:hypothetical protein
MSQDWVSEEVRALVKNGCESAAEFLEGSTDQSEQKRRAIAQYASSKFQSSNDPRAIQAIENLLTDESPLVREAMVHRLTPDAISRERWLRGIQDESKKVRMGYLRKEIQMHHKLTDDVAARIVGKSDHSRLFEFLVEHKGFVWKSKLLNATVIRAIRGGWTQTLPVLLNVHGSKKLTKKTIELVLEDKMTDAEVLMALAYSDAKLSDEHQKIIVRGVQGKSVLEALKVMGGIQLKNLSEEMLKWSWNRVYETRLVNHLGKKKKSKSTRGMVFTNAFNFELVDTVRAFADSDRWHMKEEQFKEITYALTKGVLKDEARLTTWWNSISTEGAVEKIRWEHAWLKERSGLDRSEVPTKRLAL